MSILTVTAKSERRPLNMNNKFVRMYVNHRGGEAALYEEERETLSLIPELETIARKQYISDMVRIRERLNKARRRRGEIGLLTVDPDTDKDTLDVKPKMDKLRKADRKYLKKSFRGREKHLKARKPLVKPEDTLKK